MIFLAALLFFTSCYEDQSSESIAGSIIVGALFYGIMNTSDVNSEVYQMSLTTDLNLKETTTSAYVKLLVDDKFVFIPFNGKKAIQISESTAILRSDLSEEATKVYHNITHQLDGFELYKLDSIKSSKTFDNKLFFKKGNEIIEVDFNNQSIK